MKSHKDSTDTIPKVTKFYSIHKALDTFPNYIRFKIGIRGVALSDAIRGEENTLYIDSLDTHVTYYASSKSLTSETI